MNPTRAPAKRKSRVQDPAAFIAWIKEKRKEGRDFRQGGIQLALKQLGVKPDQIDQWMKELLNS